MTVFWSDDIEVDDYEIDAIEITQSTDTDRRAVNTEGIEQGVREMEFSIEIPLETKTETCPHCNESIQVPDGGIAMLMPFNCIYCGFEI